MMWAILIQQRTTLDKLGRHQADAHQEIKSLMFRQESPRSTTGTVHVHLDEMQITKSTKLKSTKARPKARRLDCWGFSTELVLLPKEQGTTSKLSIRLGLFSKTYTARVQVCWPELSFDSVMHVQNIVPSDSAMVRACRAGDFRSVQRLLAGGAAHCNDVTEAGWPMLDVSYLRSSS
jgi:hypothetical protein